MVFIIWATWGATSPQGGSMSSLSSSNCPMLTQQFFIIFSRVGLWLELRVINFHNSFWHCRDRKYGIKKHPFKMYSVNSSKFFTTNGSSPVTIL